MSPIVGAQFPSGVARSVGVDDDLHWLKLCHSESSAVVTCFGRLSAHGSGTPRRSAIFGSVNNKMHSWQALIMGRSMSNW
jgi:hypothetical protein